MKYVFGVNKRFINSKSKKHNKKGRKYYFRYGFDLESGKFQRVRITLFEAIYYKITFIFGLKTKKISNIYCSNCKKKHFSLVNYWDKDIECPYC